MGNVGYAVMCEQFAPSDLIEYSKAAEENGFTALMVSDHFHPWVPSQGQSPFAWALMGALGMATKLPFGTGVTPPGFRYHPAILAQAAATLEAMFPGRFYLGPGRGRGAERAYYGQLLARAGDSPRDAGRRDRDNSQALHAARW